MRGCGFERVFGSLYYTWPPPRTSLLWHNESPTRSSSSPYRLVSPICAKFVNRGWVKKFRRYSKSSPSPSPGDLPEAGQSRTIVYSTAEDEDTDPDRCTQQEEDGENKISTAPWLKGAAVFVRESFTRANWAIVSACFVGLLTGISVVLFNNAVHEIRDLFWDGFPYKGASWLREEPIEGVWERVIAVPVCGGLIVGMLNVLRGNLKGPAKRSFISNVNASLGPILKTLAACITLGTGNSLGPEGPSVEIGASVAKGVGFFLDKSDKRKLSLVAAGSAAGIASGFNAAVDGCFFAVESVLWRSPAESSSSLTNATSMVILSAVIASVVSEIGLGSEPAFSVPEYDFRSPSELPLYLLLGVLCGLVSLTLSKCTSFMMVTVENVHKIIGIPKGIFPAIGGLAVGLIALAYPEILYWGFENVDILLESRPFVKGLSADLLLQLVAVKIAATSLCRASGLVGGYYAPSLFIGAAMGMAYGKFFGSAILQFDPIFHLSFLEVASPQAYGLVGMAATLAGVCQVPLTAVLLLFELTQDYRIVLPLLGAVGVSSWISSGHTSLIYGDTNKLEEKNIHATEQPDLSFCNLNELSSTCELAAKSSCADNLYKLEGSLCADGSSDYTKIERQILVSEAMRTRYVTITLGTLLTEAVNLMLSEKQSCAMIVDDDNILIGLLTLGDIQVFGKSSEARSRRPEVEHLPSRYLKELLVSEVWSLLGEKCQVLWTVTPSMNLFSARTLMNRHSLNQLPVVKCVEDQRGMPVGLLDKECINLACRVVATRECLYQNSMLERPN